MIVDDSKIIRDRIQMAIENFDLEVLCTATNGQEAIDMFKKNQPDIITMDLTMPEVDGVEAVETIANISSTVLILVVSALADKATAIEAMTKGAHGFLCKPFTEQELTDALGKLIQRGAK